MNRNGDSPWLWIIEDDPEIRSVFIYFSESEGYQTSAVGTLAEAQKLLQETAAYDDGEPFAILSEHMLPDGDSEAFLKECRATYPEATIVCIMTVAEAGFTARLKNHRIATLRKPITLAELVHVLKTTVK